MRFGKIEIDPATNPAVLDTTTWDPERAWQVVCSVEAPYWCAAHQAVMEGRSVPVHKFCMIHSGSYARHGGSVYFLAQLPDGQHVFLEIGGDGDANCLGKPLQVTSLGSGTNLAMHGADAVTVDRYVRKMRPDKGPRAMGAVPRLGIGNRMSTAVWPGVWSAMDECEFCANAIQNSVRELNLLEDVLAGRPPHSNYLFGFGTVEEGHTGSTFEGLWVAGVIEALKTDTHPQYGADADHITVRRGAGPRPRLVSEDAGAGGIDHAKRVISAACRYTFFTLDLSDILDYKVRLKPDRAGPHSSAESFQDAFAGRQDKREAVRRFHGQKRHIAGRDYQLHEADVERLMGKYGSALNVLEELSAHIKRLKGDVPFDLELSVDECPAHVDAFACLTTQIELIFLVLELRRRGIPVTHIAPNVGIVKGQDYEGPDGLARRPDLRRKTRGLAGLEKRIRELYDIAAEYGVMLDFHSGDDLRAAARRVIGRATRGRNHFKLSPSLQAIFAEVLYDVNPQQFRLWWDDTLEYARREASAGSEFAAQCLRQYEDSEDRTASPHHAVFHHYNFASVGKRDANGQFVHRERFYDLPAGFYREYHDRVKRFLCDAAGDVFCRR